MNALDQFLTDAARVNSPGHLLTFALKDGELISIHEPNLENGLACGCTCPCCRAPLVAKHGTGKRQPHFAHEGSNHTNCKYAQETALHLLAKTIIQENRRIKLPASIHPETEEVIDPEGYLIYSDAQLEVSQNSLRADAVLTTAWGRLSIEIFVTNAVRSKRLRQIQSAEQPTVEINLSSFLLASRETITRAVIDLTENKQWLMHRPFTPRAKKLQKAARVDSRPRFQWLSDAEGEITIIPDTTLCAYCGCETEWAVHNTGKVACNACLKNVIAENIAYWKSVS